MAYLSLYRKYRPQTFDEILGQEHISKTLANAIVEDRVAHAYLFTGPRGTGKTSTARILAKSLNCIKGPTPSPCGQCDSCRSIADGSSLDVIELDAASHSKVDETREVLSGVALATAGGRRKVYVIDEVHMLTTQSFNALLKTLEEPPGHVVFILATTEAHKVLPTIVSRTQRFDFRRIPTDVLATHLAHVAKNEGIDAEPEALEVVARHADGGARDALSALDQIAGLEGTITAPDAERLLGRSAGDAYFELFDAMARGDVGAVFVTINSLIAQGNDARRLAEGALEHARSLVLLKASPDAGELIAAADEDRAHLGTQAGAFAPGSLIRIVDLLATAITEMRNSPAHRLLLEIALVRAAAPETDPSALGLMGRIERLERRIGIESQPGAAGGADAPNSPQRSAPETSAVADPAPGGPVPAGSPLRSAPEAAAGADVSSASRPSEAGPSSPGQPAAKRSARAARSSPEQPAASRPPEATPSSQPDTVGLTQIKEAWQATLREVTQASRRVAAYLTPSRPVDYEDGALTIEVQSDFHESSMNVTKNKEVLVDALHAALGVRPKLLFAAPGGTPHDEPSPDEEVNVASEAEPADASSHDPVELVKKGLGAEVVEVKGDD